MRIDILTLFPNMFAPMEESIVKRAGEKGFIEIVLTDIRDFSRDKHRTVDDTVYGGGSGMVMKPEPVFAAVEAIREQTGSRPRVVMTSPAGDRFSQRKARELSREEHLLFICGHYEGIDERVRTELVDDELSIGDYVLTGGELPTMVMADAVIRLLPGVLGDDFSSEEESFSDGLLEYPQYTKPQEFRGLRVPEVLLGGNHRDIRLWRRRQSLDKTWRNRPDLLRSAALDPADRAFLAELEAEKNQGYRLFTALIHYPVYNKKREVVNTSVTNLDLHDIARASATFGVEGYFIVQPAAAQHQVVQTLIDHWVRGYGARYNPDRKQALGRVSLVDSLAEAVARITEGYGSAPKIIATAARAFPQTIGYQALRQTMVREGGNYLLLFGTGHGLADEVIAGTDYMLKPVYGPGEYNHLSVRSAASVILDRLQGEKWWE